MLLLQLIAAVLGVGLLKAFLERYTGWSEAVQWTVTTISIVLLTVVTYIYATYPTRPRSLHQWQREALIINRPTVPAVAGKITYFMGTAPTGFEAQDYARQLMEAFDFSHLSISYGFDPFPNDIVVNQGKVILAPGNGDFLLRVYGLELWVPDPKHPPLSAIQMGEDLTNAGIRFVWKPDIRLGGIVIDPQMGKIPMETPQCVIIVGSKPLWSFRSWLWTERQFLRFRSQYPPDANWVMYQAALCYAFLIVCAPLAVLFLKWGWPVIGPWIQPTPVLSGSADIDGTIWVTLPQYNPFEAEAQLGSALRFKCRCFNKGTGPCELNRIRAAFSGTTFPNGFERENRLASVRTVEPGKEYVCEDGFKIRGVGFDQLRRSAISLILIDSLGTEYPIDDVRVVYGPEFERV